MTRFLSKSIEWTNARKAYLANPGEYTDVIPYYGYLRWLNQFGARENDMQTIIIANDEDAVAFRLRFGYSKV